MIDCGDQDEFAADVRALCQAVEVSGGFPLDLALSSERMRRAGVWALEHLGERGETIGGCLDEVREFLRRAARDPELQDAVAALRRRHPEFREG